MTVSRYRVDAMDCTAEEQLVRMRLAKLEGIDHVVVDLTTRQVTVEHTRDTATVTAALASGNLGTTHLDDGGTGTERADPKR